MARIVRLLGVLCVVLALRSLPVRAAGPLEGGEDAWRFTDLAVTPANPSAGDVLSVRFAVHDADGAPVGGLTVTGRLSSAAGHPGGEAVPILVVRGSELDSPGAYDVTLALNEPGRWLLELTAEDGDGRSVATSRLLNLDLRLDRPPLTPSANAVFLQGDAWRAYYRLDPATGALSRLTGQTLVSAGDRPWLVDARLDPAGPVDTRFGGTWRLAVAVTDAATGARASTIDLGELRASVYVGSVDQPAIATAVTISPDDTVAYVYYARQLGRGWIAWVAVADLATGAVLEQRMLPGAIAADGIWARIDTTPDGSRLTVAQQVVRGGAVSGYRLTTLDAGTLESLADFRRPATPTDPLTACAPSIVGPQGWVAGTVTRYSLCVPGDGGGVPAVLLWDPLTASVVQRTDLTELAGTTGAFVTGVASPDDSTLYVVNTASLIAAEVDLATGAVLHQARLEGLEPAAAPSGWERFVDWVLGAVAPGAAAGVTIAPGVAIAPDGSRLYVTIPGNAGNGVADQGGVWLVDSASFRVAGHVLSDQAVAGVMVAPEGELIVVRRGPSPAGQEIVVVQPTGHAVLRLVPPGAAIPAELSPTP